MQTRWFLPAGVFVIALALGMVGGAQGSAVVPGPPTFSRDVAPILYAHCVECHRASEIAPMSLVTYAEARPWARAIAQRVRDGVMPPWHADAPEGTFRNERRLTAAQKDIIERWALGGAPEGDPANLPAPPAFASGWQIGTPDAIFEMLEDYLVPATGTIQYEHFYVPTNLSGERWLQAIEARPGNRSLVHHILVYYEAPPDQRRPPVLERNREESRLPERKTPGLRPERQNGLPSQLLATYAPGTNAQVFPAGTALRLAPGGTLHLELHYTATGTPGTDRSRVGMVFAKTPPAEELRASAFLNGVFTIPAGASSHPVSATAGFAQDATLWGLFPHTHLRGKQWTYELTLPDGTTQPLLSVPRYDFNWQTYYMFREPIQIPKGSRIRSTAWYDNSAANRFNPDPRQDVTWGDQTWEEMQYSGLLFSTPRQPQQAQQAREER